MIVHGESFLSKVFLYIHFTIPTARLQQAVEVVYSEYLSQRVLGMCYLCVKARLFCGRALTRLFPGLLIG